MNLLIADDEPMIRNGLMTIDWRSIGVHICGLAQDGQEALALVALHKPNIALIDINMPLIDGIQVSKIILNDHADCKIIFLTGYDEFKYAQAAISMGAFDYILKPSSPEEVIYSVKKAIQEIEKANDEKPCYDILKERIQSLWDIQTGIENGCVDAIDRSSADSNIEKAIAFIKENYMKDISLPMLSAALNLTPEYLCRILKKRTGYTFLSILTLVRMIKSVELFKRTDLTISQVSDLVGIHDPRYFSQLFKKTFKQTPSRFKQIMGLTKRKNLHSLINNIGF